MIALSMSPKARRRYPDLRTHFDVTRELHIEMLRTYRFARRQLNLVEPIARAYVVGALTLVGWHRHGTERTVVNP